MHDDLVQRRFSAQAIDQVWLADITEHPTDEGKLFLCAIKDVYSNRIVGYSIDSRMKSTLALVHPTRTTPGDRDLARADLSPPAPTRSRQAYPDRVRTAQRACRNRRLKFTPRESTEPGQFPSKARHEVTYPCSRQGRST